MKRPNIWIVAACLIVMAPALCVGQADRETWQPTEKIMDAIGVRPGMKVGEAGAGQGYFTFPLARRVGPQGVVFANDISTSSLNAIRQRAVKEGLANIKIVAGEVENPRFPEKNLDMIVMVYVLHELERPIPLLKSLPTYLRPGGPLVIIERNTTVENTQTHSFMTNSRILATMSEAGYQLDRTETFLPQDTIYIYKVKPVGDIHAAAAAGDLNKVRTLVDADPALLESKNRDGDTPLIAACKARQVGVANFLLDKGANVNARGQFEFTTLTWAIDVPGQDTGLLQRLIDKGADVNAQGSHGTVPLHRAAFRGGPTVAKLLLDNGAQVNVQGYNGVTPLHRAAQSGDIQLAELLIDHGADVNAYDKYRGTVGPSDISGTVLQVAINSNPREAMAKLLVESGAELNRKDPGGNTELHLAALKGYADLTRALVGYGADVNAVNTYGRTALYYAAKHGYHRTADALLATGAKESAIVEANYGKASQLAAALKDGEAYLWYLGNQGYAVKTKGHLLLFNPRQTDESLEAGLANGRLNPIELAGLKIAILITEPERWQPERQAFKLAKRLPGANLVIGFQPPVNSAGGLGTSSYRVAAPNESFSVGGIQVHAIPALGDGMGYLVEADGVKVFHAGLHVSDNNPSNVAKYRKEIDFLKPFGPIDVAVLSVYGHSNRVGTAYEPYLYLLEQLSPGAIYLDGANNPEQYPQCAEALRSRNIPVLHPEGGRAVGERFHYLRSQAREAQLPAGRATSAAPQRALDVTYIANEGFLIRAAGKKVLIDAPIVAPPEANPPETLKAITEGREPLNDLDLILITHQHADHLDPASLIACVRSNPKARLVAPTQVVNLLRPIDGFASIERQIQEIKGEAGARERVSHNGITFDVLCLNHEHLPQVRNLAFAVDLGGTRFLHMGDAFIDENDAHLKGHSFEQTPIDVLFLNQYDRSQATQQFIARTIKPSQIVAMHVSPKELAEAPDKIRAVYPHSVIFRGSMEQSSLPIEIDFHNLSGDYVGQPPPGATPQVFARGIVSMDTNEHSAPSFSPDGNEVFWFANRWPETGPFFSMTMRREDGRWSAPRASPFGPMPAFSPDGRRAYFYAPPPRVAASGESQSTLDIWVAEKQGDAWSEPKCLNFVARFPELRVAAMPRIARNGTLYFIGYAEGPKNNSGIYRAELINGEYARPELLPRSINLPPFLNWAPAIAPDESYLLFSSNRTGSQDEYGDLYITRRLADGKWTDPVSLGEPVNTPRQEVFPGLSPDGKYLFFCRDTPDHKNDVYWVDAASIPALRSTTNIPPENPK